MNREIKSLQEQIDRLKAKVAAASKDVDMRLVKADIKRYRLAILEMKKAVK